MIPSSLSLLTTDLSWKELRLDAEVLKQVEEIKDQLKHSSFKPGYRVLFHGPPATTKAMAALIAREHSRYVYQVDLSKLVSKYIGETEKKLNRLFDKAENKNWILFFDEADALFGKRTHVKDAHDKYANQEVTYLLQRIENYNGLVILATNMKKNIDNAFTRRLNSVIDFSPLS
jgi:SpoVK/Ycf46/Vps4 family AAA+-type ATPase